MAYAHSEYTDLETVLVRLADDSFMGLATTDFDVEFEDRGLSGGSTTTIEMTLSPLMARALFLTLAETLIPVETEE